MPPHVRDEPWVRYSLVGDPLVGDPRLEIHWWRSTGWRSKPAANPLVGDLLVGDPLDIIIWHWHKWKRSRNWQKQEWFGSGAQAGGEEVAKATT